MGYPFSDCEASKKVPLSVIFIILRLLQ